eukprot:COSAG01_NODE_2902_length_6891_cov_3.810218_4_plen_55_part_00
MFVRNMLLLLRHQDHVSAAGIPRREPSEAGPESTCPVVGPSAKQSDVLTPDATS